MKKSNWIVYAAAIVASAFLLWLWYFLELDHVDAPLDLVLSVAWWALIALACFGIHRVEKKRRERVRTCYLREGLLYNSEAGAVGLAARGADGAIEAMRGVLGGLEYGYGIQERPEGANGKPQRWSCVVRTKVFEDGGDGLDWRGEVVRVARPNDPVPFSNPLELKGILAGLA